MKRKQLTETGGLGLHKAQEGGEVITTSTEEQVQEEKQTERDMEGFCLGR